MQTVAVLHPHLLIWRDPPVWPFVWRGLLPLLALAFAASFALGPVARNWIEGSARGGRTRDRAGEGGYLCHVDRALHLRRERWGPVHRARAARQRRRSSPDTDGCAGL